jgi:EAL domain-containing protein (putative c-di-GMP-specific phosphodiesterase class I)
MIIGRSRTQAMPDQEALPASTLQQANLQPERNLMRRIIAERDFSLAFQPVLRLDGLQLHHHEVLLRLPETAPAAFSSTQGFVTLAERCGLSEALDTAVLEMALTIQEQRPDLAVAVNVSGFSVQSTTFRDTALTMLRRRRCQGHGLLLELTETAEIDDMKAAATTLAELRRAGARICLDDFGAGAATLHYLRSFGVDFVKIDGSLVHGAEHNKQDRDLIGALVSLASGLGAEIVAEMIETPSQLDLMRMLGVRLGQGWLLGYPAPPPKNVQG